MRRRWRCWAGRPRSCWGYKPMIIDFDSHLREGYFMDEVYKLEGKYERFRPVRLDDGRTHNTRFMHSLDPISPQGHAAHRHPYIYHSKTNWRGGRFPARQGGGQDVGARPRGPPQ